MINEDFRYSTKDAKLEERELKAFLQHSFEQTFGQRGTKERTTGSFRFQTKVNVFTSSSARKHQIESFFASFDTKVGCNIKASLASDSLHPKNTNIRSNELRLYGNFEALLEMLSFRRNHQIPLLISVRHRWRAHTDKADLFPE